MKIKTSVSCNLAVYIQVQIEHVSIACFDADYMQLLCQTTVGHTKTNIRSATKEPVFLFF